MGFVPILIGSLIIIIIIVLTILIVLFVVNKSNDADVNNPNGQMNGSESSKTSQGTQASQSNKTNLGNQTSQSKQSKLGNRSINKPINRANQNAKFTSKSADLKNVTPSSSKMQINMAPTVDPLSSANKTDENQQESQKIHQNLRQAFNSLRPYNHRLIVNDHKVTERKVTFQAIVSQPTSSPASPQQNEQVVVNELASLSVNPSVRPLINPSVNPVINPSVSPLINPLTTTQLNQPTTTQLNQLNQPTTTQLNQPTTTQPTQPAQITVQASPQINLTNNSTRLAVRYLAEDDQFNEEGTPLSATSEKSAGSILTKRSNITPLTDFQTEGEMMAAEFIDSPVDNYRSVYQQKMNDQLANPLPSLPTIVSERPSNVSSIDPGENFSILASSVDPSYHLPVQEESVHSAKSSTNYSANFPAQIGATPLTGQADSLYSPVAKTPDFRYVEQPVEPVQLAQPSNFSTQPNNFSTQPSNFTAQSAASVTPSVKLSRLSEHSRLGSSKSLVNRKLKFQCLSASSDDDEINSHGHYEDHPFDVRSPNSQKTQTKNSVSTSVSSPCREEDGVFYCRAPSAEQIIPSGVVDLCSYSNSVVFLLTNGQIICEIRDQDDQIVKRRRHSNNVHLIKITSFEGYLYGLDQNQTLYTLPNVYFETKSWLWHKVKWAPAKIIDCSATYDCRGLWLQTKDTGFFYTKPGQVAYRVTASQIKRIYGRDQDHYVEINLLTHQATVYPQEKVYTQVYLAALDYYDEITIIDWTDRDKYQGLAIVNYKPYYLLN